MTALAIVAAICAVIVGTAWAITARAQRRVDLRRGARLDRDPATAVAIDSTGRPYEAVPVQPCGPCGQEMPVDHQCPRGAA